MAHKHSPQFLALVEAARKRVKELSIEEVKGKIEAGEDFALIDCREAEEFSRGHLPGAQHLCKGILERDIEAAAPDFEREVVIYCGGGFRSALSAESLQKMGYKNVRSMWGGWRAWSGAEFPTET